MLSDWLATLHKDRFIERQPGTTTLPQDWNDSSEEQEVAVAEWTRGANPLSCKWVKQQGLVKGFDFDVTKAE